MYNGATLRVAWANFVRLHESSQAVRMTDPAESIDHAAEVLQESFPIFVIDEDVQRMRVLQELQGTRDYEFPALIPQLVT